MKRKVYQVWSGNLYTEWQPCFIFSTNKKKLEKHMKSLFDFKYYIDSYNCFISELHNYGFKIRECTIEEI